MTISEYSFNKFPPKYSPKDKNLRCIVCQNLIHINEDKHKCLFRRLTTKN